MLDMIHMCGLVVALAAGGALRIYSSCLNRADVMVSHVARRMLSNSRTLKEQSKICV